MSFGHAPGVTHMCYGADEYGCEIGSICTVEDGICEGAARGSDCQKQDMEKRFARNPDYWDYDRY